MVKSRIGNLVLHMYYFLFEIETARISEIYFYSTGKSLLKLNPVC